MFFRYNVTYIWEKDGLVEIDIKTEQLYYYLQTDIVNCYFFTKHNTDVNIERK